LIAIINFDALSIDQIVLVMGGFYPIVLLFELVLLVVEKLSFRNLDIIKKKEEKMKITHLKRREVQAPIVSALISAFADEIGYDKAVDIAKEVIREKAILSGKTLAGELWIR
jgi:fumarate hydratase class II